MIINKTLPVPFTGVHNPHSYKPIIIEHHLPNLFYRNQGGIWDLQRQKIQTQWLYVFYRIKNVFKINKIAGWEVVFFEMQE